MKKYSTRERKTIIDRINQLSQTEHCEILKLIKECEDVVYTQNSNGIFVNFSSIPEHIIEKIDSFVMFCMENKLQLDEYDQKINECKLNNNIDTIVPTEIESVESVQSKPLNQFINKQAYKDAAENLDWMRSLKETKQKEKIEALIDVLESNITRIIKKKTCNMKFSNAKKKFARKVVLDKKNDNDLLSCLEPESYKRIRAS